MWFYPDSHSVFFPKATRCVILSLLHFNKFFKTLLTHSTCRGIFLVNPIDFVDWFKFIHKILPGHPCLLEQRGRPAVTCRGGGPSILLTQDRSVAQKPHWGFCCCANTSLPWQAEQAHHTPGKKTERSRRGTPCCTYCYRM